MDTFEIKRNDLVPELNVALKDKEGAVVNLTGASVQFHMRAAGASTLKVDAAATLVTAASGTCKYTWVAANTDTAGDFEGEFEVTYSGGNIETFPTDGYIRIRVLPDLG